MLWSPISKLETMCKYSPDPNNPFSGLGGAPDTSTGYSAGLPAQDRLIMDIEIVPYRNGMPFGGDMHLHGNENTAILEYNEVQGLAIHHHALGGGSLNYGADRIQVFDDGDKLANIMEMNRRHQEEIQDAIDRLRFGD